MGADRIMDARLTIHVTPPKILLIVDEDFEPGAPWFDGLTGADVSKKDLIATARETLLHFSSWEKSSVRSAWELTEYVYDHFQTTYHTNGINTTTCLI